MKQPLISIVIANRNGEAFLENCLNSIFKEANKVLFEVIIVDDASEDKSKVIITRFVQKKICRLISLQYHAGISKARNIGAKKARGRYLFFIDVDTEIEKGWLKTIPSFFNSYPKTGVVQAKLITKGTRNYDSAGEYISSFGFLVERSGKNEDRGQFDESALIFSARGAAFIVRKDVFNELGGFDDSYVFYLEDTDFSWRSWLMGYQVWFLPSVTVYHAYGTPEKTDEAYKDRQVYFYGSRHTILTIFKNIGHVRLMYMIPIQYISWFILGTMFIVKNDVINGLEIYKGIISSITLLGKSLSKRNDIQKRRKISDSQLFRLVGTNQNLSFYINKARSYISKKSY